MTLGTIGRMMAQSEAWRDRCDDPVDGWRYVRSIRNQRARRYIADPLRMDREVSWGLSIMTDRAAIATIEAVTAQWIREKRGYLLPSGDGAKLRFRYLRRFGVRLERAA